MKSLTTEHYAHTGHYKKLYRHKLSDLNQCSLEGENIYCGPYLLWNSDKFSHREIYRALLMATRIMNLAEKRYLLI